VYQTDLTLTTGYFYRHISRQASPQALAWLDKTLAQIRSGAETQPLYPAFGMAARQTGKNTLALTDADLAEAHSLRAGFAPHHWTVLKATRVLLLLTYPHEPSQAYLQTLNTLFNAADVNELEALYASLPLLPYPEQLRSRCAEGIRTNMRPVLEAIVLDNPYPADYLDEEAWNQMVLKAVFNGLPLFRIHGFEKRRNASLARMLSDFAHERWAAGRTLSPEVWRAVAPFLNDTNIGDIKTLLEQPLITQHEAAALACAESTHPAAKALLAAHPDLKSRVEAGELSWARVSEQALNLS
jgi:hypothetical protein